MIIDRNPEAAVNKEYDLIVIGGGIYGVMITFEASLRGLSTLLLEQEDFGGKTSYNSLRIIHGGLRDLQSLNFRRFLKFGKERQWYLANFPKLAQSMPVLMPLYQEGLKRTELFRGGFMLDRVLTPFNHGLNSRISPFGKVISETEVKNIFPLVNDEDLKGGAVWHDAAVPDSQRLIIELLRHANSSGSDTYNYMQVTDLVLQNNTVKGVRAKDTFNNNTFNFSGNKVINATGPWSREFARGLDDDYPELFRQSLVWNVLFDRESLSEYALGVSSFEKDGKIYFLHPWKGRLLVGTGHAPRIEQEDNPRPTENELEEFIQGINLAIPGLHLERKEILHVYSGNLSVKNDQSTHLTKKDVVIDHAKNGGPENFYSVGSTKFTAARSTAEDLLLTIFDDKLDASFAHERYDRMVRGMYTYEWYPADGDDRWKEELRDIIEEESVVHLDDLIVRRTSIGDNPVRARELAPEIADLFQWPHPRKEEEINRIQSYFHWCSSPKTHS